MIFAYQKKKSQAAERKQVPSLLPPACPPSFPPSFPPPASPESRPNILSRVDILDTFLLFLSPPACLISSLSLPPALPTPTPQVKEQKEEAERYATKKSELSALTTEGTVDCFFAARVRRPFLPPIRFPPSSLPLSAPSSFPVSVPAPALPRQAGARSERGQALRRPLGILPGPGAGAGASLPHSSRTLSFLLTCASLTLSLSSSPSKAPSRQRKRRRQSCRGTWARPKRSRPSDGSGWRL